MRILKTSIHTFFTALLIGSGLTTIQAEGRQDTLLEGGWQFKLGEVSGAQLPEFEDGDWQTVSVPHCWGWEQAQKGDTNYYRGPGWYRHNLEVKPQPGKRYFLRFEAASLVANASINGQSLGAHRGGFGAFSFEITTNLSASGTNLLAVRGSNLWEPDIAPLSGDFNVYGGLYRPVHLIVTSAENFTLTDHGSSGVAWLQSSISETQVTLDVTAQISVGAKPLQSLNLVARIMDAENNEVASTSQTITPAPMMTAPYFAHLVVSNPHLWNGRKDPYLYRAVVELRSADSLVDSVEQPLGLRSYHVDPDVGFFLNGKRYPIYGVCRHQDRQGKGWAISRADMEEDLQLIKEIGATAVRCAHYQHSDYFYSLCDRAGILVWAEIPQVNTVHDSPEFEATSRNQLLDLIRQNINHSSIFVWSLFNEIGNPTTEDPHRELQNLNKIAHGEDPTRPTIGATDREKYPQMNKIPDLLGWNIYPGWYGGAKSLENFGAWLDQRRYASRSGGLCVSEYGAGANPAQHEENARQPKTNGQWHPEEWQAHVHEADWVAIKSRSFVWGSFVWNMFDFPSSGRHEGDIPAINDKGLVTIDRQIKKDAFYFYKANWSSEPTLYITGRRFTDRTNNLADVKVYSNLSKPTLWLNGTSIGSGNNRGDGVFIWKSIPLISGENQIEVRADDKEHHEITDKCIWKLKSSNSSL